MFINLGAAETAANDLRGAGGVVDYGGQRPGSGGNLYTTYGLDAGAAALMPAAVIEAVGATLACKSSADVGYRQIATGIDDAAELTRLADRLDVG